MRPTRRSILCLAVAATVLAPACGRDIKSEDAPVTIGLTTTKVPSTTTRASTTVAPAIAPPATTEPTTTAPATTAAPPPTPAPTTAPPPTTAAPDEPLQLSGEGVDVAEFGDEAEGAVATLSARLGSPSEDTGWESFLPAAEVDDAEYGEPGDYYASNDNLSEAWRFRAHRKVCWQTLCVHLGGESDATSSLRGWEWAADDFETPTTTVPKAQLAGTGIHLGSTLPELQAAYPGVTVGGAEGYSLAVDNRPWDGVFDGVAQWRMSGRWGNGGPQTVPADIRVTRLSAGEGPAPGSC